MSTQITISPEIKLVVNTTPITGGSAGQILFQTTGNTVGESANLFFDVTNGRLGVNTSTPTNPLSVYRIGSANYWNFEPSATGTAPFIQAFWSGAFEFRLNLRGGITVGGLGIDQGLTIFNQSISANAGLVVGSFGASGNASIAGGKLQLGNTGDNMLYFQQSGAAARGLVGYAAGQSYMQVRVNGATDFTNGTFSTAFFATGNIGINTTTDAGFRLDVNGTARVSGNVQIGSGPNTTGNVEIGRALAIGYIVSANSSSPQSFILGGSGNTLNSNSFVITSGGYANTLGNVGVCRYVLAAAPTSIGANSVTNLYVLGTETLKLNNGTSGGINSVYNAGIITIDLTVMEVSITGNSNVYVGQFVFRFKRYLINGVGVFTDISAVTNLYNSADTALIGTTLQAVANGNDALNINVTLPAAANTANYRMGANVTITKVNNN